MRFSILTFVTLITAATAANIRRQESKVDVETAAMTDQEGNVVAFDSTKVYQANKDAGI
ncbi:hypothetical protein NW754_006640 [Fusarium falciforme]|uniref:Uncharacterized protein n=1 Tax=Fusarium falciforme TaxID=195108 RepID=A0A9W8RJE7_9HYPO|nr:hypothetical protein NW754_006640 [Fusarium falciforme]KAJ4197696.1 hypothetical protein NW755_000393 [Fusarium falciforme]KAJ4209151.1 hypothetical protein NW767_001060 [Fusarium falciforme]KAJ4262458.1 hypothetical protein NW757_000718 [Fusarium falciforme]